MGGLSGDEIRFCGGVGDRVDRGTDSVSHIGLSEHQKMTTTPNFQPDKTRLGHEDWQRIFDALSDGMIITDRRFNILFVNRAFSALSGIDGSDLIGKKCHDVFPSELCFTPNCPLSRLRSTRRSTGV